MERPKLLIIAGPNGSGKTTITGQVLKYALSRNYFSTTNNKLTLCNNTFSQLK